MTDAIEVLDTENDAPEKVEKGTPAEEQYKQPSLLDMKAPDAVSRMMKDWDSSHKPVKSLIEQWKVNKARSKGYTGVQLIKVRDEQKAYFPLGAVPNLSFMNVASRIKRRMRSLMFSDPPLPDAVPSSDEDSDRDSAEFATRVLQDVCAEGTLSYDILSADAFDVASDYASGFLRFYIDPYGAGWRPKQIFASPKATDEKNALIDPATGQPWQDPEGKADFIRRYVRQDGTLTDNKADPKVQRVWLPQVKAELLSGRHVRFLPSTTRDLWEADAVMVGAMVPLGTLKRGFPEVFAKMAPEAITALVQARPSNVKDLLPRYAKNLGQSENADESLVFVLTRYQMQNYDYPKGAYLIACGENTLLHRGTWWNDRTNEPMDIPVTQFKQFNEDENPYGVALMEYLGPGNELLAYLFGAVLEHLDRFGRRKTFLPTTSTLQPEQLQSPTATVLSIMPNTQPVYEDIPDFPAMIEKLIPQVMEQMDQESALQQEAQGLNSPSVQSGKHAQTIVEQVVQMISDLRQNTERGLTRGWRIILQLIQAHYTVPQRISWVGDDGAYKAKEFTGADLGSTEDVRLGRGSFTQLAPSAKAALAQSYAGIPGFYSGPEELRHILQGNAGGTFGLQDNPHELRVRRQISRWQEGPPQGWQPPQMVADQQSGQAVPAPDPASAEIWEALPQDQDPTIAKLRAYELARACASTKRLKWPPEWQRGLFTEYERMRQAAGIQTVADQQKAQQQQQAAQAQAAAQTPPPQPPPQPPAPSPAPEQFVAAITDSLKSLMESNAKQHRDMMAAIGMLAAHADTPQPRRRP